MATGVEVKIRLSGSAPRLARCWSITRTLIEHKRWEKRHGGVLDVSERNGLCVGMKARPDLESLEVLVGGKDQAVTSHVRTSQRVHSNPTPNLRFGAVG